MLKVLDVLSHTVEISSLQVYKGFQRFVDQLDDLALDTPHLHESFHEFYGACIAKGVIDPADQTVLEEAETRRKGGAGKDRNLIPGSAAAVEPCGSGPPWQGLLGLVFHRGGLAFAPEFTNGSSHRCGWNSRHEGSLVGVCIRPGPRNEHPVSTLSAGRFVDRLDELLVRDFVDGAAIIADDLHGRSLETR